MDTALPSISPQDLADPGNRRLVTRLNGEIRQDTSTSDLLFDIPTLLAFITEATWIASR